MQQFQEHAVSPAETHDIHVIAGANLCFRRTGYGIVFFFYRAIAAEILRDHRKKLVGNAVGIVIKSISPQPFDGQELSGRPSIGIIPLRAAFGMAHRQPTRLLEN